MNMEQLFRWQNVLVNRLFFRQNLEIARVSVLLINLKQVQFNIPFRTQVNVLRSVLSYRYIEFPQVLGHFKQTSHNVQQLGLSENGLLLFFLSYCLH